MSELIDQVVQNPEKLLELNIQFQQNIELMLQWLKMFSANFQRVQGDLVIFNFMQVTPYILRQRRGYPDNYQYIYQQFMQIIDQIMIGFESARSIVLKSLLLAACEQDVFQGDVYDFLQYITNKYPLIKEQLVIMVEIIFQELLQQIKLQNILVDKQFQQITVNPFMQEGQQPQQIVKLYKFVQFSLELNNLNGISLSILLNLLNTGIQLDLLKQAVNQQQINKSNTNTSNNNSYQTSDSLLKSFTIFENQVEKNSQFQSNDYNEQLYLNNLDSQLQLFLQNHPQVQISMGECYLKLVDAVVNVSITLLSQQQSNFIINSYLQPFFDKLLVTRTRYIQYIIFPVIELEDVQDAVLKILFNQAFVFRNVPFEAAHISACYLMSLLARNLYFSKNILNSFINIIINYILQISEQLNQINTYDAGCLRFLQAVKCLMYVITYVAQNIDITEFRQQIKQIINLPQQPMRYFYIELDEFLTILLKHQVFNQQQLKQLIDQKCEAEKQDNQVEKITDYLPFEPVALVQSGARWVDSCYRLHGEVEMWM